MQYGRKTVWSILYVFVAFFPSLKQNCIAYRSSKVSSRPDCIFEIHQLWQSGFSRVYSNCCCSCSFEPEIIKISQLSHKMYSNNILNFQETTAILNACTKKVFKLIEGTTYIYIYIYKYVYVIDTTMLYMYSIYIFLYCHPQTDGFIISQLFSVARHTGHFKLGSKPAQLYIRFNMSLLFDMSAQEL